MTDQAIDRARGLGAFRQLPEGVGITTLGLAWLVQCAEYRVRAAVSWLMLGGLVEPAGEHRRRDQRGRIYRTRLYRWTGQERITRGPQDREARRVSREQEQVADTSALALAWLSRPPPGQKARGG